MGAVYAAFYTVYYNSRNLSCNIIQERHLALKNKVSVNHKERRAILLEISSSHKGMKVSHVVPISHLI